MDKVARKKRKSSLRRPLLLLILLGLLLGCLGAILLLNACLPLPQPQEMPEAAILLPGSSNDIRMIIIRQAEGAAYSLVRGEDGLFTLADRPGTALRELPLQQLTQSLHQLSAAQLVLDILEPPGTPADFGLDNPAATISVRYADDTLYTLHIGAQAPTETPQRYCMVEGNPAVYTLYDALCDPFFYEAVYLRDFDQPQLDAALLDRIDISGDITLSLFYTPSGWQMDAPFSYPLASRSTDYLLTRIEAMAFESCLGAPEENDLAALGLADPCLTVRLTQAPSVISGITGDGETVSVDMPEKTYTLLLGHETDRSGVYLQWEGAVYKASNFLLGFWKSLSPDDLLLRSPVNFLVNDLVSLSCETAAGTRAYQVQMVESITENNQIATDEYGHILYDALIIRAGEEQPMDAQAFLSWYVSLSALSPAGQVSPDYRLQGDPLATLTLESQSLTRSLSFYPYDALHCALAVDGVCLYYVDGGILSLLDSAP